MGARVCLIHTLPSLAPLFSSLAPGSLELRHVVDEPLLERIRRRGRVEPVDVDRLAAHVELAFDVGAAAVLVTCSNLSGCVDDLPDHQRPRVLPIDRPMLEEAARRGGRVVVLATNFGTLEPTRQSLRAVGPTLDPQMRLVEHAFDAFRQGDYAKHDRLLIEAIAELESSADTIVLAQASMARVVDQLSQAQRAKVLSSPHLALARLEELARAHAVVS